MRQPPGSPDHPAVRRRRPRPVLATVAVAVWLGLAVLTQSLLLPLILAVVGLGAVALLVGGALAAARLCGVDGDHPAVRWVRGREWRDPHTTLQRLIDALPDALLQVNGRAFAPSHLVVGVHPATLEKLLERMTPSALDHVVTLAWRGVVDAHQAHVGGVLPSGQVLPCGDVGRGQWQLRAGTGPSEPQHPTGADPVIPPEVLHDGRTVSSDSDTAVGDGPKLPNGDDGRGTVAEYVRTRGAAPAVPLSLRIGDRVVLVACSPTVLGRGPGADVQLPDLPTVSRRHATLTRRDGSWWIACTGRNGVRVNGRPVTAETPLHDRDTVRFGMTAGSPVAEVHLATLTRPHRPA